MIVIVVVGFADRAHLGLQRRGVDETLLAQHCFQRAEEMYVVAVAILDPSVSAHFVALSNLAPWKFDSFWHVPFEVQAERTPVRKSSDFSLQIASKRRFPTSPPLRTCARILHILIGVQLLLGGAALLHTPTGRAQEPGRVYRLGVMHRGPREGVDFVALLDGLRQSGFVEGQNLRVEGRFSMRDEDAS